VNGSEDAIAESREEPHRLCPDVCKTAIATNANIRRGGEEHTPFWRVRQDCAASRKIWFMDEAIKRKQLEAMTAS
jgi:hypothetical protein